MSVQVVDELITLLTFEADTIKAEKFNRSLKAANIVATGLLKTFAAVGGAVMAFTKLTAMSAVESYKSALALGVSIEQFEKLDGLIKVLGGDTAQTKSWFERWQSDIAYGGKDATELLIEQLKLIQQIKAESGNLSAVQSAKQFGWDENMLLLLEKTPDEVKQMMQGIHVGTKEGYESIVEFNLAWNQTWQDIVTATKKGIIEASPLLKDLVQEFRNWFKEMSPDYIRSVKGVFSGLGRTIADIGPTLLKIASAAKPVLKSFADFVSDGDRVEATAKAIRDIFAALVVIEVVGWISNIVIAIPKLVTVLKLLQATLATMNPIILAIGVAVAAFNFGKWIAEITKLDEYLGEMIGKWKWFQDFINWWDNRSDKVKGISGHPTKEQWTQGNEKTPEELVTAYGQGNLVAENQKNVQEAINKLQFWVKEPSTKSTIPFNVVGSVPSTSVTNNTNVTIYVEGTSDPVATAQRVSQVFKQENLNRQ